MNRETPRRYRNASIKTSYPSPAVKKLRDKFLTGKREELCLILSGAPGCGKTHAVFALKNDLDKMEAGKLSPEGDWMTNGRKRFIYAVTADWFNELLMQPFDIRKEEMEQAKNCDVLLIDDLGLEVKTDKTMSLLESVINSRYENNRTVIITTNFPAEKFANTYTDRFWDRISEWGEFFECNNGSFRQGQGASLMDRRQK